MLIVLRALVRTVGEILCVEFFFFLPLTSTPTLYPVFFLLNMYFSVRLSTERCCVQQVRIIIIIITVVVFVCRFVLRGTEREIAAVYRL